MIPSFLYQFLYLEASRKGTATIMVRRPGSAESCCGASRALLEAGNCVFFRLLQELATAGENQDAGQLRRLMTQESKHEASHMMSWVSNFFDVPVGHRLYIVIQKS